MLLRDQIPCAHNTWCDVGRRANQFEYADCQVWVKEYKGSTGSSADGYQFYIYLQDTQTRRGRHMTWRICQGHADILYREWEQLAREEVEVYEATSRYHDRGNPW